MAKGKKSGGRNFEPGHDGGPGRPPLPVELKEAKALTKAKAFELLNRFLFCTDAELEQVLADPVAPQLDKMIIAVIKNGKGGDTASLGFLLDRTIGREPLPPQEHNFNFALMPRDEIIALGKEAIKFLAADESA